MGELATAPSASLNRSAMSFKVTEMSFNSVVKYSVFESKDSGISRRRRIKNTADMRRHRRRRVGKYSIINMCHFASIHIPAEYYHPKPNPEPILKAKVCIALLTIIKTILIVLITSINHCHHCPHVCHHTFDDNSITHYS